MRAIADKDIQFAACVNDLANELPDDFLIQRIAREANEKA